MIFSVFLFLRDKPKTVFGCDGILKIQYKKTGQPANSVRVVLFCNKSFCRNVPSRQTFVQEFAQKTLYGIYNLVSLWLLSG